MPIPSRVKNTAAAVVVGGLVGPVARLASNVVYGLGMLAEGGKDICATAGRAALHAYQAPSGEKMAAAREQGKAAKDAAKTMGLGLLDVTQLSIFLPIAERLLDRKPASPEDAVSLGGAVGGSFVGVGIGVAVAGTGSALSGGLFFAGIIPGAQVAGGGYTTGKETFDALQAQETANNPYAGLREGEAARFVLKKSCMSSAVQASGHVY